MKKSNITLFFVLFLTASAFGQFGISVGYKNLSATNWENLVGSYNLTATENQSPLQEGTDFAFDYWFRLKQKRIEFHPEISYSRFIRNWEFDDTPNLTQLKSNFYNFSFHTNIYPFDFGGDCDCPTFSKDGSFVEKGLFVQLSPVVSFVNNSFENDDFNESNSDFIFGVGIGAGIDFGISDLLTVSPMVRYTYQFGAEWTDLDRYLGLENLSDNNTSDVTNIYVGIRLGFRFDEVNKYGYRKGK